MKCTDCKSFESLTRWCLYAEDYVRWPSRPQTTCRGYEGPDADDQQDFVDDMRLDEQRAGEV
jgi:hypothetical protein